jgi:hypothetical protein
VLLYSGSCIPSSGTIITCETPGSDAVVVLESTSLSVGSTYRIQVGYNGGQGCQSPVFCITVGNTEAGCTTCNNPCGPGCQFPTTPPSIPYITSNCSGDTLVPRLEGSATRTLCYTFTATDDTVDWGLIVLTNCTSGNTSSISWELQPSSCSGVIQTGGFSPTYFPGLTIGTQYTFCYTLTVAAACWHSVHWPYFVGAQELLPVEFITLNATLEDQSVVLGWSTAIEVNSAGFMVERASAESPFRTIAWVASEGAGSTYGYTDHQPQPGVNYYRLRQLDLDGEEMFSPVVMVSVEQLTLLSFVEVFSAEGILVASGASGFDPHTFLMADGRTSLPRGMYVVRYHYDNGSVKSERFFN